MVSILYLIAAICFILALKGLIRRVEARTACAYGGILKSRIHFLDLPFYETGRAEKNPLGEVDVEIIMRLLSEVRPHQIYVAGDLADPHGTHRKCTDAVLAAIDADAGATLGLTTAVCGCTAGRGLNTPSSISTWRCRSVLRSCA